MAYGTPKIDCQDNQKRAIQSTLEKWTNGKRSAYETINEKRANGILASDGSRNSGRITKRPTLGSKQQKRKIIVGLECKYHGCGLLVLYGE